MVSRAHREKGEVVPLWGTCLGIQTIGTIAAGSGSVVREFPLENYAYPLDFTPAANSSRLFSPLTENGHGRHILHSLATQNLTTNWHSYGISPDTKFLPGREMVTLTTNRALNGKTFTSSLEGANGLPVYGVQFHPESNQFDGDSGNGVPDRSLAGVEAGDRGPLCGFAGSARVRFSHRRWPVRSQLPRDLLRRAGAQREQPLLREQGRGAR